MITIKDQNGRTLTRDASWIKKGTPAIQCNASNRITSTEPNESQTNLVPIQMEVVDTNRIQNSIPLEPIRRSSRITKQTSFYVL